MPTKAWSTKEMVAKLHAHEVFKELTATELIALEGIVHYKTFEQDEVVFDVGSRPNFLYYVIEGNFTLYFPNNEHLELSTGELIGELGLLNGDFRLGTLRASADSKTISVCGTKLFEETYLSPTTALKIVRKLGRRITNYFRSSLEMSSVEMIEQGESEFVEFKSTLRWNLYTNKKDKAIELAILKTIAAFMNSEGGHLFVGISDEGKFLGLAQDKFPNHDKLLLHLTTMVKKRIGTLFLQYIHTSIEVINAKEVLRVDCLPASHPAYVFDDNDDYFFVRTGPATTKLKASKIHPYIKDRFEST